MSSFCTCKLTGIIVEWCRLQVMQLKNWVKLLEECTFIVGCGIVGEIEVELLTEHLCAHKLLV